MASLRFFSATGGALRFLNDLYILDLQLPKIWSKIKAGVNCIIHSSTRLLSLLGWVRTVVLGSDPLRGLAQTALVQRSENGDSSAAVLEDTTELSDVSFLSRDRRDGAVHRRYGRDTEARRLQCTGGT